MRSLGVVLLVVAFAAAARLSTLRAEFTIRAPRMFNGTIVVIAGAKHATDERAVPQELFAFVDDATGLTAELEWSAGAHAVPRQSTHGALNATFNGLVYVASSFAPGE